MMPSNIGRRLWVLIAGATRLNRKTMRKAHCGPNLAALMEPARGMIDSGVPDLASNPDHLAGFSRDGDRHH
jgi:hypothetical protein